MPRSSKPRMFGVDYQFLSCGSVFTDGLAHAAAELGVDYAHAGWDDPHLLERVQSFAPDLLFVVHGRRFAQRFGGAPFAFGCETAIWLLDEPYEVDDTASFSPRFGHVFVNDRATLDRHPHATYLPTCYDPRIHKSGNFPRIRKVGFIGGANSTRDRYLGELARAGVLDYVVGGIWSDPSVQAVCLGNNIRPAVTAELYGVTRIVVNVFRETHHFNRDGIAATSLNPRAYEATACGALVVSEWRPEIETICPEMPTFRSEGECVELVRRLLDDPEMAEAIRLRVAARLEPHTYGMRLQTVLARVGAEVAA